MSTASIIASVDAHQEEITELSRKIWENPEIGWKETKAVRWTAELLERNGFSVETGAYGMPTAIRAVWGNGNPVVGFCGEYDCLPGLSQKACPYPDPAVPGGFGHGCGHNLLGAGCVGAAIALKETLEKGGETGTVIFYGCPAEELESGKGWMAKAGAFTECDFTIAWHPAGENRDSYGEHMSIEEASFRFTGTSAHAASHAYLGRSALDAVQLMNIGCEFLREHVTDDVRIHYEIVNAGGPANVVPDLAEVSYMVRALKRETVIDAFSRVVKCAEGAAHMTETEVEVLRKGAFYPTLQNHVIGEAVQEARKEIPAEEYTEEELRFADQINRFYPEYEEGVTPPMSSIDQEVSLSPIFQSTDYGDVEHIRPGFQVREACAPTLYRAHSWSMTASAGSPIGVKGMLRAAKLMAAAAYKVMTDPARLQAAQEEFEKAMAGKAYESPLSEDLPWPYGDE